MTKTGVLLINIGTPSEPSTKAVRTYLREFLGDKRVVKLPWGIHALWLHALILPLRSQQSAKAYQKIWTPSGSPLLINSQALTQQLTAQLGERYKVALGMRYGYPSIVEAVKQLAGCEKIIISPLFPHYSVAATGSAVAKALEVIKQQKVSTHATVIDDFYGDSSYLQAYAAKIQEHIQGKTIDTFLFSYHGLPEYQIDSTVCRAHCSKKEECPAIDSLNRYCYRAQCYATSRYLAQLLRISNYRVSFQSRLGRIPWIKPYTDELFVELIAAGKLNIAIACPSFVADCLETLEEIGVRGREQWQELGGKEFILVPCLNDDERLAKALAEMIEQSEFL